MPENSKSGMNSIPLTISTMKQRLEQYLASGFLSENERAKFYLIVRYSDKVSRRLLDEYQQLLAKGKRESDEWFKIQLCRPLSETVLGLIPKEASPGFCYRIPFRME